MTNHNTILQGFRILDLTRLAPGPYGSMLLADLGAEVIVVGGGRSGLPIEAFCRGKKFINLDMKTDAGVDAFKQLAMSADVVMEGFRPGVTERLGIGYEALRSVNPRLIYCSLTGYGQDGPMAQEAGHDINYLGLSGALGALGPASDSPAIPLNLVADFAGGGLYAAYAILGALLERERSALGQHLDVSMVDGCLSLMAMHYSDWGKPVLPSRGKGLLTGEAPFYRCYTCADGKQIVVGALETAFFKNLWQGFGFEEPVPDHMNRATWSGMTVRFEQEFARLSRDAWVEHFAGKNACVSPALMPDEVFSNAHIQARHPESSGYSVPALPRYSRSSVTAGVSEPVDHSVEILSALGLSSKQIEQAVPSSHQVSGLVWPPVLKG